MMGAPSFSAFFAERVGNENAQADGQEKGREQTRGPRVTFDLVSRSAVATTSATATGSPTPSAATSATATRSTTPSAVSAAVRTISGRPFSPAGSSDTSNCIPVEVGFVVGEIPTALDGQRRGPGNFAVTRLAAIRSGFTATHLCALLFEDGLARKTNAVALNRQHFHQNPIALFEFIPHILDAMLRHFTDV